MGHGVRRIVESLDTSLGVGVVGVDDLHSRSSPFSPSWLSRLLRGTADCTNGTYYPGIVPVLEMLREVSRLSVDERDLSGTYPSGSSFFPEILTRLMPRGQNLQTNKYVLSHLEFI